jgi:hypothetical protein
MLKKGERVYEKSPVDARKTDALAEFQGTGGRRHMSDEMRDKRTAAPVSACPSGSSMRQYTYEF